METGEIDFAKKKTAKTARETDSRNNAESRKSESGLDIRFRVRSEFIGQEFENADSN